MTQSELNRMVAQATGESISIISGRGFVPLTPIPYEGEPQTASFRWRRPFLYLFKLSTRQGFWEGGHP